MNVDFAQRRGGAGQAEVDLRMAPLGLANVRRDQDRRAEAETLYRQALEIRQRTLPPGHPELRAARADYEELRRRAGDSG